MAVKPSSIVGGPLDDSVIGQLSVRKEIVSKRSDRSQSDILYLNSPTGWVKMTSSVDQIDEDHAREVANKLQATVKTRGTSTLAEKNVLLGGTAKSSGMQGGIFNKKDSAYDNSNLLGYRPMAGITSFQVDTKNTFGTLRVASVNFKANSIEQLDELEQLFLRPGFTVLLEWGHSTFVDNIGKLRSDIWTYPNSFFDEQDKVNIHSKIDELKKQSGNNYDAMYGVIKNFVWAFNLDGGYDCKVDIVSMGELVESLKILISPSTVKVKSNNYFNEAQNTTSLHGFLNIVKNSDIRQHFEGPVEDDDTITMNSITDALKANVPTMYEKLTGELKKAGKEFHVMRAQLGGKAAEQYGQWTRYITVSTLLQLINQSFLLTSEFGEIIKFYIGDKDTNKTSFLTFQPHIALDPQIAVLPKKRKENLSIFSSEAEGVENIHYKIAEQSLQNVDIEDILNIYINIDYIISCADATIKAEAQKADSVFDFITTILEGLQSTMGDINDFQLHYQEEESTYYIVDKKLTPSNDQLTESYIDIMGLNSTLENVSFSSKLSSNITSMMAISAQFGASDSGSDLLAMQTWQRGLQDRHNRKKIVGFDVSRDKEEVPVDDLKRLGDFIEKLNSDNMYFLKYDGEEINGLLPTHRLLTTKLLEYYTIKQKTNPAGLIPFELSFTMKGIGGIKIGQAFRIDDNIIPKRYRGQVAFLVTGVSHSLSENRWKTDIKTQMVIAKKFGSDRTVKGIPPISIDNPLVEEVVSAITNISLRKPIDDYKTSSAGVNLIKRSEAPGGKAVLKAYKDPGTGNTPITIGFGTTRINGKPFNIGYTITEAQAEEYLKADLIEFEKYVKRYVRVNLTQQEFDALVSFTYNFGPSRLATSTLLKKLNSKDYIAAADQFLAWNQSGGKVLPGLTKRRAAEKDLFLTGSPGNES